MRTLYISIIICLISGSISTLEAQCDGVESRDLKRLARSSFDKKLKMLRDRQAKTVAIKTDSLKCEYRTIALCKNYISDTQWHWREVLTFNSCDQILTYSTADSSHYHQLTEQLMRRSKPIGDRSYQSINYQVYQLPNKQILELNQHRNKEGMMFYMINLLKS